jgi:DNA helicase II / ATP-dependent DNA helicase PcrA
LQKQGKKVVFTNGVFDLLHIGHLRYLEMARSMGDVLVVAINTDKSVKKLKGNHRPLLPQKERAELLAGFACVDYVTFFSEDTPLKTIVKLHPDVLAKGADYKIREIVGAKEVTGWGGKVKRIAFIQGYSTTKFIKKIKGLDKTSPPSPLLSKERGERGEVEKMNYLDKLNPPQLDAVTSLDKPVLVLAGAGSGKTRVITYRIAYSIAEGYSQPMDIFAVTFTNKAAGEMKSRVENLLGNSVPRLWISTFHSSCVRILRQHIDLLGYKRDFTIYDEDDQSRVVRQILKEMKYDSKQWNPRAILSKISQAKSQMMAPEDIQGEEYQIFYQVVAKVFARYNTILKQNNAVDFDDLLTLTVKLLENHPMVRDYYQNRFKHILIDEYQDTNHVQYRMLRALAENTTMLCAVGDDDQSIYAWRGADINNILNFEQDYPSVKVVKLEQNYRSTQPILDAANRLIKQNPRRNKKHLWTEKSEGIPVMFNQLNDELDEARWVCQQIYDWKNQMYRGYDEVAVFYRTHAQSRAFEDVFRGARIPYVLIGGIRFYDRKEVKDLLAYLRVIVNPNDEVALKRIINIPTRAIGETTIEKIAEFAAQGKMSFYDALQRISEMETLSSKVKNKIKSFMELLDTLRQVSATKNIADFLHYLIDTLGYTDYLKNDNPLDSETRVQNVQELVSAAADFEITSDDSSVARI